VEKSFSLAIVLFRRKFSEIRAEIRTFEMPLIEADDKANAESDREGLNPPSLVVSRHSRGY